MLTMRFYTLWGLHAGSQPASAEAKGSVSTYCSEHIPLCFGLSHHSPPQRKALPEVLTPKQPKLPQHLAMHHSGSVILTSSGWKNAVSLANSVPFLDRSGDWVDVKKIARTVLLICVRTLRQAKPSPGAAIPLNPRVSLGEIFWVNHYHFRQTKKICLLSTVQLHSSICSTGSMQCGTFSSTEMKVSGSLGLCKINHVTSPCFPRPAVHATKPWAKHVKEKKKKTTAKEHL